ncbi:MAG TPA: hypothetical protein VFZ59_12845 [Verrucomicrobiae bacterium]|nr:hypothetical protein [Verrucomicrobiae bacterium]
MDVRAPIAMKNLLRFEIAAAGLGHSHDRKIEGRKIQTIFLPSIFLPNRRPGELLFQSAAALEASRSTVAVEGARTALSDVVRR